MQSMLSLDACDAKKVQKKIQTFHFPLDKDYYIFKSLLL